MLRPPKQVPVLSEKEARLRATALSLKSAAGGQHASPEPARSAKAQKPRVTTIGSSVTTTVTPRKALDPRSRRFTLPGGGPRRSRPPTPSSVHELRANLTEILARASHDIWSKRVTRRLRKVTSAPKPLWRPATQTELLKIKKSLHLDDNSYHRVVWTAIATMFQGACRPSDILNEKLDFWNERDVSRAFVRTARTTTTDGTLGKPKYILSLMTTKTDTNAFAREKKSLVYDSTKESVSAAAAIYDMLYRDKSSSRDCDTPLFRIPGTLKPLTIAECNEAFLLAAHNAGIDTKNFSTYSLRSGVGTAYMDAESGGAFIAKAVGGGKQTSNMLRYVHASDKRVDEESLQIGRVSSRCGATRLHDNIKCRLGPRSD